MSLPGRRSQHPVAAWASRGACGLLQGLVHFYRLFFSTWLGAGCRFTPTCSVYALEALERHGALGGTYLAARRVLRCHPGCEGGRDDVPAPREHPSSLSFPNAGRSLPDAVHGRSGLAAPSPETLP